MTSLWLDHLPKPSFQTRAHLQTLEVRTSTSSGVGTHFNSLQTSRSSLYLKGKRNALVCRCVLPFPFNPRAGDWYQYPSPGQRDKRGLCVSLPAHLVFLSLITPSYAFGLSQPPQILERGSCQILLDLLPLPPALWSKSCLYSAWLQRPVIGGGSVGVRSGGGVVFSILMRLPRKEVASGHSPEVRKSLQPSLYLLLSHFTGGESINRNTPYRLLTLYCQPGPVLGTL